MSLSKPLVSVVVPTYNRAHCIIEAVESVLCQDWKDLECIVVDDGSTDDTRKRLEPYFEKIRYLYQQNSGVSTARNTGIKAARGEWIAFLDSDDIWEPDKLKIQMNDLMLNPTAIVHIFDVEFSSESGSQGVSLFELRGLSAEYSKRPFRERPLRDVLTVSFFTQSCIIRRDIFEVSGIFNPEFKIHEDFDLLTRVALCGPFYINCYRGVKVRRLQGVVQPLSDMHETAAIQSYQNLIHTYNNLKGGPRLNIDEQKLVCRLLGGVWCEIAEEYKKVGYWSAFIDALYHSIAAEPGIRSLVRALLTVTRFKLFIRKMLPSRRRIKSFSR